MMAAPGEDRNTTGWMAGHPLQLDEESAFQSLTQSFRDFLYSCDTDYRILYMNESLVQRTGRDATGELCYQALHDRDTPCPWCAFERVLQGETVKWQGLSPKDGRWFHAVNRPIVRDGKIVGKETILQDITERRKAESTLLEEQNKLEAIMSAIGDGITALDRDLHIIYQNHVHEEKLGKHIGEHCYRVFHNRNEPCDGCQVLKCFSDGKIHRRQSTAFTENGLIYLESAACPLHDAVGNIVAGVEVVRDISDHRRAEEEIKQLAYYDSLTGLPNRTLLKDRLGQALAQAERDSRQAGVLLLDLDRFKGLNDTRGHTVGDRLLQSAANRLQELARAGDTVARLGGDEFAIVFVAQDGEQETMHLAKAVLDRFTAPFSFADHDVFSTASIGIALFPADGRDVDTLLKNADIAMYAAKERGRNQYKFFSAEMTQRAEERMALETCLRRALEREEFSLHYQPQINLQDGWIIGMEALLRWQSPDVGQIPPGRFIPVAEDCGLILPIGEWVLRTACRQAASWLAAGYQVPVVAVNISAIQFRQENLAGSIRDILEETGLPASHLELELTETILMEKPERAKETLWELKRLGISLAIDDFGTGYSSLNYLKHFPLDRLKIDQSFVADITTDPNDAAIADAIIALARSLGLSVIAEGVETREQVNFLQTNQCYEMQGYFFSHPVPPEACTGFFTEGLPTGDQRLFLTSPC